MSDNWFEVSASGLRKTLAQKDPFFLIKEMVSNAWDAKDCTRVEVTLTKPVDGVSTLSVTDNSPQGFIDLSHSYTMYAESEKKDKAEKRGRFNAGEKDVIARSVESKLTTTTGQVVWNSGGRTTNLAERRNIGTEFIGRFELTVDEFENMSKEATLLLTPEGIETTFNGEVIPFRKPSGSFRETLPSPSADKEGVMRNYERKGTVLLYEKGEGETAMIYEMGIPIVELDDDKYHVNVMQKTPLSRDRDNVHPSYLAKIRAGVLNATFSELNTTDDVGATWVKEALSGKNITPEAITHVVTKTYGANPVTRSVSDIGSANEAVSKGARIIEGGAFSKEAWANIKSVKKDDGTALVKSSAEVAPTNVSGPLSKGLIIPHKDWTKAMKAYAALISNVLAPRFLGKRVIVEYIDNEDARIEGCYIDKFRGDKSKKGFQRDFDVLVVNLAYTDPEDTQQMYTLILHELAHDTVRSNDHLHKDFYYTVETLGGKLAELMIAEPKLFKGQTRFTAKRPIGTEVASQAIAAAAAAARAAD